MDGGSLFFLGMLLGETLHKVELEGKISWYCKQHLDQSETVKDVSDQNYALKLGLQHILRSFIVDYSHLYFLSKLVASLALLYEFFSTSVIF